MPRTKARFGLTVKDYKTGKTAKDRESGAKERNASNKRVRAGYQNENTRHGKVFPKTTCNGKKNRHRWMNKGGNYVVHAQEKIMIYDIFANIGLFIGIWYSSVIISRVIYSHAVPMTTFMMMSAGWTTFISCMWILR